MERRRSVREAFLVGDEVLKRNGKALRVLIVEDQALTALDLKSMIEEMGGAVVGLPGSGELGVTLARELDPDIVLMDIQLAGLMDGVAAGQAITARSNSTLVFVTANTDSTTMARIRRAGDHIVLQKPILAAELREALVTACDLSPPEKSCEVAVWQVAKRPQRARTVRRTTPRGVTAPLAAPDGSLVYLTFAAARLESLAIRDTTRMRLESLQALRARIAKSTNMHARAARH